VRNAPYVAHSTAMRALNVSEATFYRMRKKELKPYIKKGFVYSAQVRDILDRAAATCKK
jgi:hypothetical protein